MTRVGIGNRGRDARETQEVWPGSSVRVLSVALIGICGVACA